MDFIDLQDISRWYGKQQALNAVTLRLERGRIGLLGPNGAGKSTLLKILLGLLPPSSGSGRVLGLDLGRDGTALRRVIGYMPEADALIPGMAGAEYVALAGELYGMPRRQALRRAHEVLTYLDLEDARYRRLE
jgi:ABC-2 type transport system ATP-binding protein